MSIPSTMRRGPIYFCYANPAGFSGQKAATELVMRGLTLRGWLCRSLPQPMFDRTEGGKLALLRFVLAVLAAWLRSTRLLASRDAWLCVNLGQTRSAFCRDVIPLLLGRLGLGRGRVVVSLHGSLFMGWVRDSRDARLFRLLLANAGQITILGESQRRQLVSLGVPDARIRIVVNSCDLAALPADVVAPKHLRAAGIPPTLHCLHLSSLIDTKGYPEYLEALQLLSQREGDAIDAVLCGRLVASDFSGRFPNEASAESWIEQILAEINRSTRVRVRWVKGATGAAKAALFHHAQVFLLPTRYAVEAQPIVLLEAMASGCAIVTTQVGEIPSIIDGQSAILRPEYSAETLAATLQGLSCSPETCAQLAVSAHSRFMENFQVERHLDAWEALLDAKPSPVGGGR
jgi:glycosyltransferase involved in cell wall biosynthesis